MNRLQQKVTAIMESQARFPFFSLATLLHAGSILYGGVIRNRQILFEKGHLRVAKLPCPVISIGNITAGGTGKTPMTLHLAQLLGKLGYGVVVISRGYKGAGEKYGAVVSDRGNILCGVDQSGDEPLLMAKSLPGVPVVVGRNRFAAGALAIEKFQPDVILLDDGFQHQQLARDLNILLVDAQAPFGNSFLLPRGSLREPISAVLRADVVMFTRCSRAKPQEFHRIEKMTGSVPVFCTSHRPVMRGVVPAGQKPTTLRWTPSALAPAASLANRRVVAFSGLAHNRLFWGTIPTLGGRLAGTVGFDDHHPYRQSDLRRIVRAAHTADCDCLVTSDKDLVRLPVESTLPFDLIVMGVTIDFAGEDERWRQFIAHRLGSISKNFNS